MCLTIDLEATKNLFKDNEPIIAYKIVWVYESMYEGYKLRGPVILDYIYSAGWNKVTYLPPLYQNLPIDHNIGVTFGIHVYLSKKDAEESWLHTTLAKMLIVPVKCYKEDLIGASLTEAAFKKVFLEEPDYREAITGASLTGFNEREYC